MADKQLTSTDSNPKRVYKKRKRKEYFANLCKMGRDARYQREKKDEMAPDNQDMDENVASTSTPVDQVNMAALDNEQGAPVQLDNYSTDSEDPDYHPTPTKKHLLSWSSEDSTPGMYITVFVIEYGLYTLNKLCMALGSCWEPLNSDS